MTKKKRLEPLQTVDKMASRIFFLNAIFTIGNKIFDAVLMVYLTT